MGSPLGPGNATRRRLAKGGRPAVRSPPRHVDPHRADRCLHVALRELRDGIQQVGIGGSLQSGVARLDRDRNHCLSFTALCFLGWKSKDLDRHRVSRRPAVLLLFCDNLHSQRIAFSGVSVLKSAPASSRIVWTTTSCIFFSIAAALPSALALKSFLSVFT